MIDDVVDYSLCRNGSVRGGKLPIQKSRILCTSREVLLGYAFPIPSWRYLRIVRRMFC